MRKPTHTSDDDEFAREMTDVVPLPRDPRGRVRTAPPREMPGAAPPRAPARAGARGLDVSDDEACTDFAAPGVDRREIRKLKRGEHAAAERHDLHGMTGAEACASAVRFIERSRRRGHRCVCLIHGRGVHSGGKTPVLRVRVRACLASHHAVLAYADAPRADGGPGAVYVLLRR